MNNFLKNSLPHLGAIFIMLVICIIYFYPQLEGKKVRQGDVIQFLGMTKEVNDFKKATGETSLWTNSMFGGMPTYQIRTIKAGNNLKFTDKISKLFFQQPIGRFIAAMLGFYILMIVLGVNRWVALFGAVSFGLTTNSLILYEAGHMTKLRAISFFPLLGAGLLLAFRKNYTWGGIIFALGLGMNLMSGHPQMTYYLFLTFIFFGIAQLISSYQKGELPHFAKATGVITIGLILALASNASSLWVTMEYAKDTMRGEPILKKEISNSSENEMQSSSETDGLSWDYAMQWSNNGRDVLASFIPGVTGGSGGEKLGANSATVKSLKSKGVRVPKDMRAPLYWGALPFTSGPAYMGAIVVFLFFMGLLLVKGPLKWWIGLGVLLTFLLSMGKNLEGFNEFFFNYVPLYNKFRTPNSVLSITSFLMPLLAFLALDEILKNKNKNKREVLNALKVAGGITAGLALFIILAGSALFDFSSSGDARLEQMGYPIKAIMSDRKSLMLNDAIRSLALVVITGGGIWAYIQNKIKQQYLFIGIGLLVIFDVWTIGQRYLDSSDFVKSRVVESTIKARPVDEQILNDKDPDFRVLDLTVNPFQSSFASYFHKSLGGYHAAKLQRYQDIIDHHLTTQNMKVINMLNTKYIITPSNEGGEVVQQNPNALGNAWFVNDYILVKTPNEEIEQLNNFSPAEQAVIHEEFSGYLNGLNLQKGGSISITSYQPNRITYSSQTTSEQLAIFSEIWYGPDKGWQAYLDGKPVEHVRANYILRAMRIPAGSHQIEFVFDPKMYEAGKIVSFISSGVILLALFGFGGFALLQVWQSSEKIKPQKQQKDKTVRKKKKKKK